MPIGVIAVLVVAFRLHLDTPAQHHNIDYLGAGLLTAGVSALILVTTWGGDEYAWRSTRRPGWRRCTCWSSAWASASSCRSSSSSRKTTLPPAMSASRPSPPRSFARWAARSAWRSSERSFASRLAQELTALPGAAAARLSGGIDISPDQVHALPAGVRHDFLLAFVDALQPVFLVGAGLTAVTFALAWLLKEVPLRATAHGAGERSATCVRSVAVGATDRTHPGPRSLGSS